MLKKMTIALAISAATLGTLTSCGGETEKYIESWKINWSQNTFNVNAVFNQQYEIDGEALIKFKNYGTVYVGQDDQRRFSVNFALDKGIFGDIDLTPASSLPTGVNFPNIVTMPMVQTKLMTETGKWTIYGYFGQQDKKWLAGAAIQLDGINNNFPVLSVTQNYFKDNQRFASFTIYGPKLDANGNVLVPGGLFVVADVNMLIDNKAQVQTNVEISGQDAHLYQDQQKRDQLMMEIYRQLESTGLIRKK